MLQWGRTKVGVDYVTGLSVEFSDPFGELHGVGNGGGEEDVADAVGQEDDGFFPHDTSFYYTEMAFTLENGDIKS